MVFWKLAKFSDNFSFGDASSRPVISEAEETEVRIGMGLQSKPDERVTDLATDAFQEEMIHVGYHGV